MIGAVREWLTAIVVVTMLISVVQSLIPEGSIRKAASFTGGLVLLAALLRPVLGADLEKLDLDLSRYQEEVEQRQTALEETEEKELAARIAERTAAYISDKADTLGLTGEIRVKTRTGEAGVPLPWSVEVDCARSAELESWLEGELGIPKERQVWHGREGEN